MRQCPTLPDESRALIAQTIDSGVCMQRQRGFYHKCHRCIYNGKPADFRLEPVSNNGTAEPETAPPARRPSAAESL